MTALAEPRRLATERVAKFLGNAGLAPMPVWNEQPHPVRAEEEGAGARQGGRGRGGLRPSDAGSPILLGVIGRPHGVRGLVQVTSHTADPADLTAYGPLSDAAGRCYILRWTS